jgi:hypothetical protein
MTKRIIKELDKAPMGFSVRVGGYWPHWWAAFQYRTQIKIYYFRIRWWMKPRLIFTTYKLEINSFN